MQLELLLPVPPGPRTYHGGLQELLELPGLASPRRKAKAPSTSFQWSSKPNPSGTLERYCSKATRGDNQCNPGCIRENRHAPLTSVICGPTACRGAPARAKEGQNKFSSNLEFSEEDKIGSIQPYDDSLLITLRIGDYDVKRVMVDGGSAAEVMYPDLYKGLNLKLEDLTPYRSHLMSFDRKLVIPKGMIRLPIYIGPEVVEVNFIMVDTYSPHTTIVGRP